MLPCSHQTLCHPLGCGGLPLPEQVLLVSLGLAQGSSSPTPGIWPVPKQGCVKLHCEAGDGTQRMLQSQFNSQ